jgi:hypothetical protein
LWSTQIVDVRRGQLVDVVPGRDSVEPFLNAGVLSEDGHSRDTKMGTPQGGILSPLLANIALSVLDDHFAEAWEREMGTRDFTDREMPFEVRRLGRTIAPVGCANRRVASLPRHRRADRSRQQPGEAHQAGRVRTRELPTSPSPMSALRRCCALSDLGAGGPGFKFPCPTMVMS